MTNDSLLREGAKEGEFHKASKLHRLESDNFKR